MNTATHPLSHGLQHSHFLTDGGMETDLVFNRGIDLPCFASFDLLSTAWGRATLVDYYCAYLDLAVKYNTGFILETPTWRANRDWGDKLGYSGDDLVRTNREAIALMKRIRSEHRQSAHLPVLVSGNIGPRGDGYQVTRAMSVQEARQYHGEQLAAFAEAAPDMISAFTLNYLEEALGIALAARDLALPAVISFTLETDGRLPSGQALGDAINDLDGHSGGYPLYYMINCAHPSHFESQLVTDAPWRGRIGGIRGNASKCSHAELDEAVVLDDGDPLELGQDYRRLQRMLPNLKVYGGCCGTDLRHVASIAELCLGR